MARPPSGVRKPEGGCRSVWARLGGRSWHRAGQACKGFEELLAGTAGGARLGGVSMEIPARQLQTHLNLGEGAALHGFGSCWHVGMLIGAGVQGSQKKKDSLGSVS